MASSKSLIGPLHISLPLLLVLIIPCLLLLFTNGVIADGDTEDFEYIESIINLLNNRDICYLPSFDEVDRLQKSFERLEKAHPKDLDEILSDDEKLVRKTLLDGWDSFKKNMDLSKVIGSSRKYAHFCKVENYQLAKYGFSICTKARGNGACAMDFVPGPENSIESYIEHLDTLQQPRDSETVLLVDGNKYIDGLKHKIEIDPSDSKTKNLPEVPPPQTVVPITTTDAPKVATDEPEVEDETAEPLEDLTTIMPEVEDETEEPLEDLTTIRPEVESTTTTTTTTTPGPKLSYKEKRRLYKESMMMEDRLRETEERHGWSKYQQKVIAHPGRQTTTTTTTPSPRRDRWRKEAEVEKEELYRNYNDDDDEYDDDEYDEKEVSRYANPSMSSAPRSERWRKLADNNFVKINYNRDYIPNSKAVQKTKSLISSANRHIRKHSE